MREGVVLGSAWLMLGPKGGKEVAPLPSTSRLLSCWDSGPLSGCPGLVWAQLREPSLLLPLPGNEKGSWARRPPCPAPARCHARWLMSTASRGPPTLRLRFGTSVAVLRSKFSESLSSQTPFCFSPAVAAAWNSSCPPLLPSVALSSLGAPRGLLLPAIAVKEKGHQCPMSVLDLREELPGFPLGASLRPPCDLYPMACAAARTVVVGSEVQAIHLPFL